MVLILIYHPSGLSYYRMTKILNQNLLLPPMLPMDYSSAMNHSDFHTSEVKDEVVNTQDREFLSVLEDLMDIDDPLHSQNKNINVNVTSESRIFGYFCSDIVFNLSHRVLTETEIKVLEKTFGLCTHLKGNK